MPSFFGDILHFASKILVNRKAKKQDTPIPRPDPAPEPTEDIQRIPDYLEEFVTSFRILLSRTDPYGRSCSCKANLEVDAIARQHFEHWLNMIIDARVQTKLRELNDSNRKRQA